METLWVIIRSEVDESVSTKAGETDTPTVCGVYKTREEAVEETLKLYIEDDIDLTYDTNGENDTDKENGETENKKESDKDTEISDYYPTPDLIKKYRLELLNDVYSIYTNRGNLYKLIECVLGAKHEFDEDVLEMYNKSNK
jgi:hypothetical protein